MSVETKRFNEYDRPFALAPNVPQNDKKPCPFGSGLLFFGLFSDGSLVSGARTTLDLLCSSTDLKPKLKL